MKKEAFTGEVQTGDNVLCFENGLLVSAKVCKPDRVEVLEKKVATLEKSTQPKEIKKLARENLEGFFDWCTKNPLNP